MILHREVRKREIYPSRFDFSSKENEIFRKRILKG
jgi:hypothetical protein